MLHTCPFVPPKPDTVTLSQNAESEVIVQYLCDKFEGQGPSLRPNTPEARAIGHVVTRLVDVYIQPIQV